MIDRQERLLRRVEVDADTGCWNRSGAHIKGYPVVKIAGKQYRCARLAYELYIGPIEGDLTVDHLCRNIACVNPEHLELVTASENVKRAKAAQRVEITECPQGHVYDEQNTYLWGGRRSCRTCRNQRSLKYAAARR